MLIEVEVFSGALPLPVCSLVLFPAARTPIRACDRSGEGTFSEDLSPFHDRFVIGLEPNQTPGQFHQRSAQTRIAVFGHAALQSRIAAGVFAGAEPGVAGHLAPITEAMPIANLSIDNHTGH